MDADNGVLMRHCVSTGRCTDSATSVEHGTSVKMNTKKHDVLSAITIDSHRVNALRIVSVFKKENETQPAIRRNRLRF